MASPVPKPDARKQRHAIAEASSSNRVPTVGRSGRPPNSPLPLGDAGKRWWRWAWSTPQACRWHKGFLEPLARRAALEDELARLVDHPDEAAMPRILALALRLDDRFGLTPMAAAQQHIVFVDTEPEPSGGNGADDNVTPLRKRFKS